VFVVAPAALGYLSRSYKVALIPGVALALAIIGYLIDPPAGTDEADVLSGLYIVFSAAAVAVCLAAAAFRRRSTPHSGSSG
jgi:hypothetical protein